MLAEPHLAAVPAFPEPLREAEHQIEAEVLGHARALRNVVERP